MKKWFLFIGIVFLAALVNFNISLNEDETTALGTTLKNIRLIQAYADSEIGRICYGCQETGDYHDFCVLCIDCEGRFNRKSIGDPGTCL